MKRLMVVLVPAICLGIYDMEWFDLNNWKCPFYNDARWGIDITIGTGAPGGSWPQPLKNFYIFGAGPWIGTIIGNDTLVTIGYNPNTGQTEMFPALCRYWRQPPDSADRIYKYPGDWPPPLSRFPMAPQESRSEMDLWTTFSDSNPNLHIEPGRPLGIDIYLTIYGFNDANARDFFFLKYELANASGAELNQLYFGMVVDADIGDYSDDMAGLILNKQFIVGSDTFTVKNTAFFYDYDNTEYPGQSWESGTPGAIAIRLLRAPEARDLSAFKRFSIEIDPVTDPQQYLTLKGYNYNTGEYEPFDSIDPGPADKRGLLGIGPFNLKPDSVLTFYFAVIAAPYGDSGQGPSGRDTTELALRSWWAERFLERILAVQEPQPVTQPAVFVYPNPCRLGAPLFINGADDVRIYDIQGRLVNELQGKGKVWDGKDFQGRRVAAGVYFVRTGKEENGHTETKVLLINR
ncbi:MAG: T9SS type A sorting domain-containing protein [candidate division WOR-3 bacterium]